MIPRGVLDIDWQSLAFALAKSSGLSPHRDSTIEQIELLWNSERPVLVYQSVRSAFDALLATCNWPRGSEILMSAATIPDMVRIVLDHGLVAVPIDVQKNTLAPLHQAVKARITPRTRAIVIAHLFGSRLNLESVAAYAQEASLLLIEDVAQSYAGPGDQGDPLADISLFSFGLIKSRTALGGGIMRVRDRELAMRCRNAVASWPRQSVRHFRNRILRAMLLRILGTRLAFSVAQVAARLCSVELDQWLVRSLRGFPEESFFDRIRRQPCEPMLQLLERRLSSPQTRWVQQRTDLGKEYNRQLPKHVLVGQEARFPTRWVFPISCNAPDRVRRELNERGYDATRYASQLRVIDPAKERPEWDAPAARQWVSNLLYLPLHPALRSADIKAICETVHRAT